MQLSFDEVRLLLWSVGAAPRRADVAPDAVGHLIGRLQAEYHRLEKQANASPKRTPAAHDGGRTQPAA